MDDKAFFSYYIPALEKAFSDENMDTEESFNIVSPNWFYPKEVWDELDLFENSHYDEYPVLEHVWYYFDAVSHGSPIIFDMKVEDYKDQIQEDIKIIRKKFDL